MKRVAAAVPVFCIYLLLSIISKASGDTIVKPNTFMAGNPAVADEVNANFDTVYDQVNKIGTEVNIDTVNHRVGIGTALPAEKLDVSGKIRGRSLQVTTGATDGHVLTSDASGNATWQALPPDGDNDIGNEFNNSLTMNNTMLEVNDDGGTLSVNLAEKLAIDHLSDAETDDTSIFLGKNTGLNDYGNNYNIAIGHAALQQNTYGQDTIAIGYRALNSHSMGGGNIAVGNQALYKDTDGSFNIAYGSKALYWNTTGDRNCASGFYAMHFNDTGNDNTAIGYESLTSNRMGSANIAIGTETLKLNSTAGQNTALGNQALFRQSFSNSDTPWNSDNTAVGYQALYSNAPTATTNGYQNSALGSQALYSNADGKFNTAGGYHSLYSNTTGFRNTATGHSALHSSIDGISNTASGYKALYDNISGNSNTANGDWAIYSNTTGSGNTALGSAALSTNTTGSNNTAVGYSADVSTDTLQNATAIGYGAIVNATNKVRIGNSSVSVIEGQVAWSYPSDERLKEGIEDSPLGLDFIKSLRPVAYRMKDGNERTDLGFIAQDIEALVGVDYNILGIGEGEERTLSLKYTHFIAPMVRAMQEQQGMIETLRAEGAAKDALIADLLRRVEALELTR